MSKRAENSFSGMLVIYKEAGYTSSDVVAKLRGILHMRRIGHTGTLDPMAEGVLPVCLGGATRLAELIADRDKEYVARLRLGVLTDTQDMTGRILQELSEEEVRRILLSAVPGEETAGAGRNDDRKPAGESGKAASHRGAAAEPSPCADEIAARIDAAAQRFRGEISQIPPMYSAVWVNGQRLYDLARKGVTVERAPRTVTISELEIQDIDLPYVTMRVVCSKGTYIRTLCEDLGNALGTGGAMEHLLRTRVGQFTLDQALTLGEIQSIMDSGESDAAIPAPENAAGIRRNIIPIDTFFAQDPEVHVKAEDLRFLQNGNPLSASNILEGRLPRTERIRVYDADGTFWALYRYDAGRRRILPVRMFHETQSVGHDRKDRSSQKSASEG